MKAKTLVWEVAVTNISADDESWKWSGIQVSRNVLLTLFPAVPDVAIKDAQVTAAEVGESPPAPLLVWRGCPKHLCCWLLPVVLGSYHSY
jgi:hypothetical protein